MMAIGRVGRGVLCRGGRLELLVVIGCIWSCWEEGDNGISENFTRDCSRKFAQKHGNTGSCERRGFLNI
jgi:hypothetical protein